MPDGGPLGNGRLGHYARGLTASQYREGQGKLLKDGAQIVLGVLYVPNGVVMTDCTSVGLHFQDGTVQKHTITRAVGERKIEIEPHVAEFPVYATYEFAEPVTIWSLRPEMHYRGSSFKFIAHYPDGPTLFYFMSTATATTGKRTTTRMPTWHCRPAGEWNSYDILVEGSRVVVVHNGWKIIDADLEKMTMPIGKFDVPFAEYAREGYLTFQDHGGEVWYRNILIREISSSRTAEASDGA